MELHQIRYFLAVARERNFTRAAQACNVSQPSLTRGISKLESELGGLLFERKVRGSELTELGRLILPQLQRAYGAVTEAIAHAHTFEARAAPWPGESRSPAVRARGERVDICDVRRA
jgi:LysR family transcriptional regulator, hydrogen peroxide-inducible genes activator